MYVKNNDQYTRLNAKIQKSVKLDQYSFSVVENSRGKNFSEKLRNIIAFYDQHKREDVLNKEKE